MSHLAVLINGLQAHAGLCHSTAHSITYIRIVETRVIHVLKSPTFVIVARVPRYAH